MMRVLIVDDEPLARSGVCARLSRHADMRSIGECADGESALLAIQAQAPDLVFMDVQMPGMSGLDVLGQLPAKQRPMTILLTAYDSFAIRAFEIHALDYLLKPVDDDRFDEALDRARQTFALRRHSLQAAGIDTLLAAGTNTPAYATRFTVRIGHRIAFIDAAEVDWIEASGDYAGLHVDGKVHLLREPLHQLARRLDSFAFIARRWCVSTESLSSRRYPTATVYCGCTMARRCVLAELMWMGCVWRWRGGVGVRRRRGKGRVPEKGINSGDAKIVARYPCRGG